MKPKLWGNSGRSLVQSAQSRRKASSGRKEHELNFNTPILFYWLAAATCSAQTPANLRPIPTLNHPMARAQQQRSRLTMPAKKKGLRMGTSQKEDAKRAKQYLKKHGK